MSSIEDWISLYPGSNDPNFASKLAKIGEFAVLAGKPEEPLPAVGQAYNHQKLFQRIYDIYNRALVIDAPGTGKTCLVAALTESLARQNNFYLDRVPSLLQPPLFKRIYVLVKGKIVEDNFKSELACRCTKGTYVVSNQGRLTSKAMKNQITRQIDDNYSVMTYVEFLTENQNLSDRQLQDKFHGTVIIVDEAHNLLYDLDEAENNRKVSRSTKVYNMLFKVAHSALRMKVVLLTATPMRVDAVEEFSMLVNILRPLNSQMPTTPEMSIEEFTQYAKGYVMYVRELDTGVDFKFQGFKLGTLTPQNPELTTIIQPLEMSPFQSQGYNMAFQLHGRRAFSEKLRQASNLIFPDGTYGDEGGFSVYTTLVAPGKWQFNDNMLVAFQEARREYPNDPIYKFSSKFHFLEKTIRRKHIEGKKGYVHMDLKKGSGLIALGLLLELMGIERFYQATSVFPDIDITSFCPPSAPLTGIVQRTINIDKKLRYALLIPELPAEVTRSTIELFNSAENTHGEYISCLLISPVGRESISLDSIQWMAENPTWVWASAKQSIYRGRRTTSHIRLLRELRTSTGNPTARIDLDVYLMASYPGPATGPGEDSGVPIDIHMYTQAELTARSVAPYLESARAAANDCYLEHNRNVRPDDFDKNYTPECDYGRCNYKCLGTPITGPIDNSGLIRKYADEYRETIMQHLIALSRTEFVMSIAKIISVLVAKNVPEDIILIELSRIVDSKIPLINRFGQRCYFHLSNGYVVVSSDYPVADNQINPQLKQVQYMSALPAVYQRSFEQYLAEIELTRVPETLKMLQLPAEQFLASLSELDIGKRSHLFEAAFISVLGGRGTPAERALVEFYNNKIFSMEEPITEINTAIDAARRSTKTTFTIPNRVSGTPELIYLHTIRNIEVARQTRYNVPTRSLKPTNIRIYKPSANTGWRDLNPVEEGVYQKYIEATILAREAPFTNNQIYGFVILDDPLDEMWVVDGTIIKTDAREKPRGHACSSLQWRQLGDYMYRIGLTQHYANVKGSAVLAGIQANYSLSPQEVELRFSQGEYKMPGMKEPDLEEKRWLIAWNEAKGNAQINITPAVVCRLLREFFTLTGRLMVR